MLKLCDACLSSHIADQDIACRILGVDSNSLLSLIGTGVVECFDAPFGHVFLQSALQRAASSIHGSPANALEMQSKFKRQETRRRQLRTDAQSSRRRRVQRVLQLFNLDYDSLQTSYQSHSATDLMWCECFRDVEVFIAVGSLGPFATLRELVSTLRQHWWEFQRGCFVIESLKEHDLPAWWIDHSTFLVDREVDARYPELSEFIDGLGSFPGDGDWKLMASELVSGIHAEELQRRIQLSEIQDEVRRSCPSEDMMRTCAKSTQYRALRTQRHLPSTLNGAIMVLAPVVVNQEGNVRAGHSRKEAIDVMIKANGVLPPFDFEMQFFSMCGRLDSHPLSLYEAYVSGLSDDRFGAVQAWQMYSSLPIRARLVALINDIGLSELVNAFDFDFGDILKLHLIRFLSFHPQHGCPFEHTNSLCSHETADMETNEDGQENKQRSSSSAEDDMLIQRDIVASSRMSRRAQSHSPFRNASHPVHSDCVDDSMCYCATSAVPDFIQSVKQWVVRSRQLQQHFGNLNLLQSQVAQTACLRYLAVPFRKAPTSRMIHLNGIYCIKFRGFFNLCFECPSHQPWLFDFERTKDYVCYWEIQCRKRIELVAQLCQKYQIHLHPQWISFASNATPSGLSGTAALFIQSREVLSSKDLEEKFQRAAKIRAIKQERADAISKLEASSSEVFVFQLCFFCYMLI